MAPPSACAACFSFAQKPLFRRKQQGEGRPPLQVRLTTGYWNFRGLGAPMRMMCAYAQCPHVEDVQYEATQTKSGGWSSAQFQKQMPQLREQNPLVSLPYVINHGTGEVVSQSNAVYLYLGRLLGLNGETREEQLANEQVLIYLHGMFMEMRDLVYPSSAVKNAEQFRKALENHFKALTNSYENLTNWLAQRNTRYFAGVSPCTADFHVWEMFDQQEALARAHDLQSPLAQFSKLQEFYEDFRQLAGLRSYFESDASKLPFNNKMAFFK